VWRVSEIKETIPHKKRIIPTLDTLKIEFPDSIIPHNAGLFISRGKGSHPERTIDSTELIFVVKGTLDMFEENEEFHLKTGDILLLFPDKRHGGLCPYSPDTSFYWIHFSVRGTSGSLEIPQCVSLERPDRMKELFRAFLDQQESGGINIIQGTLLIMLMLDEILSFQARNKEFAGAELAAKALNYITVHAFEDISTSQISVVLKCNPDYLGRVFRCSTGKSVIAMIHELRIKKARQMLLDLGNNIDETAAECGFNETSYFRKVFKKLTGMSPAKYRKLYSAIHINTL